MAEFPEWYDGKHVNEVKFCEEFLREHPMKSVNGTFFTVEGRVTDEDALRREITKCSSRTSPQASANG